MAKAGKALKAEAKLLIKAGQATQGPPVATCLGPHGVNTKAFVDEFNKKSLEKPGIKPGTPVSVKLSIYEDRTVEFKIKNPPASYLLMEKLKLKKGSSEPNKTKVGTINRADLEEIAKNKWEDLSASSLEAAVKTIAGTARSMGINIELGEG